MNEAPLVSLCIPTFNRAPYLRVLLESIDRQNVPESMYDVHVRDNASTDDSKQVFSEIAKNRPNWHWCSNERNLGARANIRLCTLEAPGRFLWIVGSDDHLKPEALSTLGEILPQCLSQNAAALFLCERFGPSFATVRPFNPAFEWLRYVSVNVPAFISAVVWDRHFWCNYRYDEYPAELSLPQLDAFLLACMNSTVFGLGRALVNVAHSERAESPTYYFFRRHAISDVIEYPLMYKHILKSERMDIVSRIWIWLRRTANLRHVKHKLLFMRYNEQYYHMRARDLKEAHGSTLLWPLVFLMAKVILEWRPGAGLARREWGGTEKLPAQDKIDLVF